MKKYFLRVLLSVGVGLTLFGCGGGGGADSRYEFAGSRLLSITLGPAERATPNPITWTLFEVEYSQEVPLNEIFSALFRSGENLTGTISYNTATPVACTYSLVGDPNGEFDLDIAWFESMDGLRMQISIKGADLNRRTLKSWKATKLVTPVREWWWTAGREVISQVVVYEGTTGQIVDGEMTY